MSSLSLRQITPDEAYRAAKDSLRNTQERLDRPAPGQTVGWKEALELAQKAIRTFQDLSAEAPNFSTRNQKLQEKLNLIQRQIMALGKIPPPLSKTAEPDSISAILDTLLLQENEERENMAQNEHSIAALQAQLDSLHLRGLDTPPVIPENLLLQEEKEKIRIAQNDQEIAEVKAVLAHVNTILERELKRGQLANLVAKLPKPAREEILRTPRSPTEPIQK